MFIVFNTFAVTMTIEKFIHTIELEFDEVALNTITPENEFRQLEGWSSMLSLIIISKIKKVFNVTITSHELANAKTIEDLFIIASNKYSTAN